MKNFPVSYARVGYSGFEPCHAFDVVYGGHFEHRLIRAGLSNMEHERLVLGQTRLQTGRYDFPVVARGGMPGDTISIGFVAEGIQIARYNTLGSDDNEVQIYPEGVDVLYHAQGPSKWIIFSLTRAELEEAVRAATGRDFEVRARDAYSVRIPKGMKAQLLEVTQDALELVRALPGKTVSEELASAIRDALKGRYVLALASAEPSGDVRRLTTAGRHHQLILACEKFVAAHEGDVSLPELARYTGYSERAIELVFRDAVSMTPGRWFINVRLNGTLRELLSGNATATVSEIAERWGFGHLPRFAQAYHRAFGELPSRTRALALARSAR